MARDNYSYQKYKKEQARKKKREEKLQRKLDKKKQQAEGGLVQDATETTVINPEETPHGQDSPIQ